MPIGFDANSLSADIIADLKPYQAQAAPLTTESFRAFVSRIRPRYQWYPHCERLAAILQRVADGEVRRLMVFMPPRHGKSEEVSRLFTAYFLLRYPDRWVGINSYAAELAYTLSRSARENYLLGGGTLRGEAKAVKHWQTTGAGGLWAAGVGGPITGKGFHLGVIDDPLKNAEEAASEVIRAKQQDWYASTFYTREEPGGAIILIQTRWHEADLSGWALAQEEEEQPEGWHIVSFPAVAEAAAEFPASCTIEPDPRATGEPLCADRYPAEKLAKIERRVGAYYWGALFQQRPTARDGSFFKVARLEIVDAAPKGLRLCRGWDFAASTGASSDWTAGVLAGIDAEGIVYILHVERGRWPTDERNNAVKQAAWADGDTVKIRLPQDPGQAGIDQALAMARMLAGFPLKIERVTGSKETRADSFAAQVNVGNVRLLKGAWNRDFIEELRGFPLGAHDDQVDAVSDSYVALAGRRQWNILFDSD